MYNDLFEKKFVEKLSNYENKWGADQRALHLVEEVGEFAEILLQYKGYKSPSKDVSDIKVALADILEDVLALTILYKIPMHELFDELIHEKNL